MIVYLVTNKINNKVYVGQTVRTLGKRKREHLYDTKRGSTYLLHRAIRKYGEENFTWEIIYHTDNLQDLNAAEEYLIAEYGSRENGYNVKYGGDNHRHAVETRSKIGAANKGKTRSVETLAKMSAVMKGKTLSAKTRAKISAVHKGRIPSAEHRAKNSAAQSGEKNHMYGKHPSAGTRARMSAAHSGEKNHNYDHKIYSFSHQEHGLVSATKCELRTKFSLSHSALSEVVSGKRQSHKGWRMAANYN